MWYPGNFEFRCPVRAYGEKKYHERRNKSDGCFEAGTGDGGIYEVKRNKEK
jgi:hypothetical protein